MVMDEAKLHRCEDDSRERPRILLQERQPVSLATLSDALSLAGFAITATVGAVEALLSAQENKPALAIIEQSAYDGEGAAHAAQWQKMEVPLAFTAVEGTPERIRRALDAGAVGYFLKPVDPAQLAAAVQVALRRTRERLALAAELNRLRDVVDDHNEVGIAVGLLMAQRGLPRHAAFDMLRQHARRNRRRVSVVAAEIASLATRLNDIQDVPRRMETKDGRSVLKRSRPMTGVA